MPNRGSVSQAVRDNLCSNDSECRALAASGLMSVVITITGPNNMSSVNLIGNARIILLRSMNTIGDVIIDQEIPGKIIGSVGLPIQFCLQVGQQTGVFNDTDGTVQVKVDVA